MDILIISGISGSGKSRAATVLEDIGYYVVDNLPAEMISVFMEVCKKSPERYSRMVFVYDVRAAEPFDNLLKTVDKMKQLENTNCQLVFLDAETSTIINRYKETRRVHPFSSICLNIEEAIEKERSILKPLKDAADIYIDTTAYSTIKQRSVLISLFGSEKDINGIQVTVESFGFKHGVPKDVDLLFDVRFLPNPYYVDGLKRLTGLDKPVYDYVFNSKDSAEFIEKIEGLLSFLLPRYRDEGKSYLKIGIGCTGGHHRSVAIAHYLCDYIGKNGFKVMENHRDILV